jgi:hypothetical protein
MKTALCIGIVSFIAFFLLTLAGRLLSLFIAYIIGRVLPSTSEACSRYIAGMETKRGCRKRLLLPPAIFTFAVFAAIEIRSITDEHQVRHNIRESTHLMRFHNGGYFDTKKATILFETTDKKAIFSLAEQISLGFNVVGMRCACLGDMTFDFYKDQKPFASLCLHHGKSIRIKGDHWGDKPLTPQSQTQLKAWLDQTGISTAVAKAKKEEEQRFKAANQPESSEK